ncbi:MAG: diguanylate cyclase [Thermoleophilia bacterium]
MSLNRRLMPLVLAALLFAATLLVSWTALRYEDERAGERATLAAERAAHVTRLAVGTASGSLVDAAGLFEASDDVRSDEFAVFARRAIGRGGLSGIGWMPRVPAGGLAAYEERTGLTLVESDAAGRRPADPGREHFPVTHLATDLATGGVLGVDPSGEPRRAAALRLAATTATTALTPPVALYGSGARGLVLYHPVYAVGGAEPMSAAGRMDALRGYIVGSYRLDALMGEIIRAVDGDTPVEIRDGDTPLSASTPAAHDGARVEMSLGGREWVVLAGRPPVSTALPLLILGGGLALTLLVLALALVMARRDRYAQEAVTRATAELRAGEDRYRSLVTSMSDGVLVQDATGAVTSCNPAAVTILGVSAEQLAGRRDAAEGWRVVDEHGHPLDPSDRPSGRTMRTGEPLDGVVVGIRRPGEDPVWLSVSTRARDDDGPGGREVVTCFADITARVEADREQAALRRVATLVASGAGTGDVLDLVAREAAALAGSEAAGIVRFEAGGGEGTVVGAHAAGLRTATGSEVLDLTVPTAAGMVAGTDAPARLDGGLAGHADGIVPGVPVSCAVAAPIRVDNRLWGALTAVTTRRGAPLGPATGARLERLGELVALAILSSDARDQLATLAGTDDLTGLPNRRTFTERLAAEIERAVADDTPLSLVVLGIDHFKRVNDTHGHPAGDRVLMGVAAQLFAGVRETEMVARIGGEEFAWILPETAGGDAVVAAERLRRRIGGVSFDGVGAVTISMGVCDLGDARAPDDLLRLADAALYEAKEAGRDRVVRHVPARPPATAGAPVPHR